MPLVKTFLYAVGDARLSECKFGFESAPSYAHVVRHIKTRYRSVYRFCRLLFVVPVPTLGTHAEAKVKDRLAAFHPRNEFLAFPDDDSMMAHLSALYAELACPEADAFLVESNRNNHLYVANRRRLRDEADAATTARLAARSDAKRRKGEAEAALAEERDRTLLEAKRARVQRELDEAQRRRQEDEDRRVARRVAREQKPEESAHAWAAGAILELTGGRVLLSDAWKAYSPQPGVGDGQMGRNQFRALLKQKYEGAIVEDRLQPARTYIAGYALCRCERPVQPSVPMAIPFGDSSSPGCLGF